MGVWRFHCDKTCARRELCSAGSGKVKIASPDVGREDASGFWLDCLPLPAKVEVEVEVEVREGHNDCTLELWRGTTITSGIKSAYINARSNASRMRALVAAALPLVAGMAVDGGCGGPKKSEVTRPMAGMS